MHWRATDSYQCNIYRYSSYEEPIQAVQDSCSGSSNSNGGAGSILASMDLGTFV